MNHNEFFESLKAGHPQDLYLMEGTEEYIKGQAVARLCRKLLPEGLEAMNLTELDNPEADTLIAAAETLPFLSEKRVVIVRELDLLTASKKGDDAKLSALQAYLPNRSPSTCLVFVVKGKADAIKGNIPRIRKRKL